MGLVLAQEEIVKSREVHISSARLWRGHREAHSVKRYETCRSVAQA